MSLKGSNQRGSQFEHHRYVAVLSDCYIHFNAVLVPNHDDLKIPGGMFAYGLAVKLRNPLRPTDTYDQLKKLFGKAKPRASPRSKERQDERVLAKVQHELSPVHQGEKGNSVIVPLVIIPTYQPILQQQRYYEPPFQTLVESPNWIVTPSVAVSVFKCVQNPGYEHDTMNANCTPTTEGSLTDESLEILLDTFGGNDANDFTAIGSGGASYTDNTIDTSSDSSHGHRTGASMSPGSQPHEQQVQSAPITCLPIVSASDTCAVFRDEFQFDFSLDFLDNHSGSSTPSFERTRRRGSWNTDEDRKPLSDRSDDGSDNNDDDFAAAARAISTPTSRGSAVVRCRQAQEKGGGTSEGGQKGGSGAEAAVDTLCEQFQRVDILDSLAAHSVRSREPASLRVGQLLTAETIASVFARRADLGEEAALLE